MRGDWLGIQESKPFFWVVLKAWLKSKNASFEVQNIEVKHNQYVKVKVNDSMQEYELTTEMLIELFDDLGIRLCVDFNKEQDGALWNYTIYANKPLTKLWYLTYSFDGFLPNRKCAILSGIHQCISEVNSMFEKESKE